MTWCLIRAELARLRGDHVLLGFLAFIAVTTSVFHLTGFAELASGPVQATVVALFYGTIRYGVDHHQHLIARTVLFGHRTPALVAKVVVTALRGAVLGVFGTITTASATEVLVAAPAAAASAVTGLAIGVIVGSYLISSTVSLLAHLASMLVLDSWPRIGRTLPLGATVSIMADGPSGLLPNALGALVLLAWTAALGAIAWLAMHTRDLG